MKDFGQYIKEEIELRGNRGVPDDFMGDTDREAGRDLGFNRKDTPPYPGSETRRTIDELMPLIDQGQRMLNSGRPEEVEDRFTSLEELAEQVIMDLYGDILDNVILDLKLVRPGEVNQEIGDINAVPQEPEDVRQGWIDDLDLARKIDKQKLINSIVQGEGLNTKNILHSDQVKYGLQDIFGAQSTQIFDIWDRTTKLAQRMDWLIPIEAKADMLANQPQGMAGAVQVEWVEEKKEDDEDQAPEAQDEFEVPEEDADIQPTEYDPSNDEESEFDSYTPKIKVRAIDFPMLLHEAVKGIYELIGSISVPDAETATEEEIKDAETVKKNTSSMTDEAEDFRYGPYIAGALRTAVNECDGADDYPNTREHIFGKLCEMDAAQFLVIMKKILDKNDNAKDELEILIQEINGQIESEERDYQLGQLDNSSDDDDIDYGDTGADDDLEYADGEEGEASELDQLIARTARGGDEQQEEEKDPYASMSDVELGRAIDVALDDNNMELVRHIGSYLNKSESLDILVQKIKNYLKA